ncbi:MAG TPA: type II secretion system F family protein, partial [Spirochaetota bacterium]|nr:type II secretion system F family protein [Spirochaetota bacterium]
MVYYYKALNKKGQQISDIIDAANEVEARKKLKSEGLYVVSISQKSDSASPTNLKSHIELLVERANRSSAKKQVGLFSRQLATLLKAGMPL